MADAHFMASDPNVPGGNGSMTGDQADEIIGLLKQIVELAKPGAEVSKRMLEDADDDKEVEDKDKRAE